jgi:hypothetical protein
MLMPNGQQHALTQSRTLTIVFRMALHVCRHVSFQLTRGREQSNGHPLALRSVQLEIQERVCISEYSPISLFSHRPSVLSQLH